MSEHPQLRAASPEDAPAIAQLEQHLFGASAWSETMVSEELTAPHRTYVVLEHDGTIVGYAGLLCVGIEADVQTIAVTESVRGRGLGRLLLQTLIDEAVSRGAEHLFLEVREDNDTAIRMYERMGLQPIARRERYYQPENKDAIVMHMELRLDTREGDPS